MNKIYNLVSVIVIWLFVVCCTTTSNPDKALLKLGAMSSMDYIPYVLACELGYYDSLGMDVEIVKFFSANDRDAALQSGNIDATVIDFTGAILQHSKGINIKLINRLDGLFYLIASRASGIERVEELKSGSVAVSRNTVVEFSTDLALLGAGVNPGDVEKPEINKIPLRLEMLENGKIDATILPNPFATIAIARGNKQLLSTRDLGLNVTGTVVRGEFLEKNEELVRKLLEGYDRAVEYINSNPGGDWKKVLKTQAGVPDNLVDEIEIPEYKKSTLPNIGELNLTLKWLKNKELVDEQYLVEEVLYDVSK